jgi:hypothetical protein
MTRWVLAFLMVGFVAVSGCQRDSGKTQSVPTTRPSPWTVRIATEASGATSYIFEGEVLPPLVREGTEATQVGSINAALFRAGLPMVDRIGDVVKTRGFGTYRWDDYPRGEMVLWHTFCSDRSYKSYEAIWKFTIYARK